MHIKYLQKADTLLKRLQSLDKEIIQIEKYAQKVKDMHQDIQLSLSHEKADYEKIIIDEDGSLPAIAFNPFLGGLIGYGHNRHQPIPKTSKENCEITISEVVALQVLGVLVSYKEAERMGIVNRLIEMGFEVSL